MTDPFTRHGIKHLSPSKLNLFRNEPALFIAKYLYGVKDEAGPKASRGTAVEGGVDAYFAGEPFDKCLAAAKTNFALNTGGQCDDDHEKQIALLEPMLRNAIKAFEGTSRPNARQLGIELRLDGIEVPVIGFADWVWDGGGLDLKTTERMPSKPKQDHVSQVAIYSAATGRPFRLLYVTDKKYQVFPRQDEMAEWEVACAQALADMRRVARSLRKVLALSKTREEVAEFYTPNFESFYWNPQTQQAAQEIWA